MPVLKWIAILTGITAGFCCCQTRSDSEKNRSGSGTTVKKPVEIRHAKGFRIVSENNSIRLILMDPWHAGEVLKEYRIGERDLMEGQEVEYLPISSRLAISSTTHAGFLHALDCPERVVGMTQVDLLYAPVWHSRVDSGFIQELGRASDYNLETLLVLDPDLVLMTGIEGQLSSHTRLLDTGLPILYIFEWMEETPLGRSEWIKVFGLITGNLEKADSLFDVIEASYQRLRKKAHGSVARPTVLSGNNFKGTWYLPGGKNYMARFFEDAGLYYPLADTDNHGSLAWGIESVLETFSDAELWIGVSAASLPELKKQDEHYARFHSFLTGSVYSVSNRISPLGANDFWESGVVRPDWVLADLICMAHPEILPDHVLRYYTKLSAH